MLRCIVKTLATLLLCLFLAASLSAEEPTRYSFEDHEEAWVPLWTFSGTMADDGSFYLVDTLKRLIVRYSRTGEAIEKFGEDSLGLDELEFHPTFIQIDPADPGRLIVQVGETGFMLLDAKTLSLIEDRGKTEPLALKNEAGRIERVYTWVAARDYLMAFADIKRKSGEWFSAFVRIPRGYAGTFTVVGEELEIRSPARQRQNLGYSFSAVAPDGETTFALLDGSSYRFLEVTPESAFTQEIKPVEKGSFKPRRPWKEWSPRTDTAEKLQQVAEGNITTHVIVDEDYFYLVRKGDSKWHLDRIPRGSDSPSKVDTRDLQSSAPHLVVVPGGDELLIVEKGKVRSLGNQLVTGFFRVDYRKLFSE